MGKNPWTEGVSTPQWPPVLENALLERCSGTLFDVNSSVIGESAGRVWGFVTIALQETSCLVTSGRAQGTILRMGCNWSGSRESAQGSKSWCARPKNADIWATVPWNDDPNWKLSSADMTFVSPWGRVRGNYFKNRLDSFVTTGSG